MIRKTLPILLLAVLAAAVPARDDVADAAFHFALEKSAPAADATVEPPQAVKLWFTQVPQEGTTSIRVLDAAGEPVPTSDITQAENGSAVFSVAFESPPAAGTYTVSWRALGQDGHVVRDTFSFTVRAR